MYYFVTASTVKFNSVYPPEQLREGDEVARHLASLLPIRPPTDLVFHHPRVQTSIRKLQNEGAH